MRLELELALRCVINRAEGYSSIPIASLDNIVASVHDQDWHVEFFNASVDLVYAVLYMDALELLLPVSSKGERCAWIRVMGA